MTNANDAGAAASTTGGRVVDGCTDPDIVACIEAGRLSKVLEALSALVAECRLTFGPDGLAVTATDPAVVASVDVSLERDAFETYEGATGTFGLDVERLSTITGLADRDQPVTIAVDAGTRQLFVAIGELEYAMGLLDPETVRSPPDPDELDFEFAGGAVLDGVAIDRFVAATDLVADHLAIELSEASLAVAADGDVDSVSIALGTSELREFTPGEARSLYSLEYLHDMSRAIPADAVVSLEFGTDIPISLSFTFAEGAGAVEYVLSPRIARN